MLISLATIVCIALIAALWPAREHTEEDNLFYFIHVTDPHIPRDGVAEKIKMLTCEINELPMPIDFVAVTGDITNRAVQNPKAVEMAKEAFSYLKAPVHMVIGNEDINVDYDGGCSPQIASVEAFVKGIGPLSYVKEYHGVVCLFMCTAPLSQDIVIEGYDTFAWLEQSLKEANGKPVLIFHHWASVQDYTSGCQWPKEHKQRWEEIINSTNVKAEFTGHTHRSEQHWIGNVPVYIGSALSGRGETCTFQIFEYFNGRLSYLTRYWDWNLARAKGEFLNNHLPKR